MVLKPRRTRTLEVEVQQIRTGQKLAKQANIIAQMWSAVNLSRVIHLIRHETSGT